MDEAARWKRAYDIAHDIATTNGEALTEMRQQMQEMEDRRLFCFVVWFFAGAVMNTLLATLIWLASR